MKKLFSLILFAATISFAAVDTPAARTVGTPEQAIEAFRRQYDASPNHLGLSAGYDPSIKDPKQLRAKKLAPEKFARFRRDAQERREHPWRIYGSLQPFTEDIEVWWITNTDLWHPFGAFLDAQSGRVFFIQHYSTPF